MLKLGKILIPEKKATLLYDAVKNSDANIVKDKLLNSLYTASKMGFFSIEGLIEQLNLARATI